MSLRHLTAPGSVALVSLSIPGPLCALLASGVKSAFPLISIESRAEVGKAQFLSVGRGPGPTGNWENLLSWLLLFPLHSGFSVLCFPHTLPSLF